MPERVSKWLYRAFWATLNYAVFLSPFTVFALQLELAGISVSFALVQKLAPSQYDGGCTLNSKEENEMGYSQILAILMLALAMIAAFEAFKGQLHISSIPDQCR